MKNLADIKKILRACKPLLARDFKVKSLGVFGSCVRGEQARGSDVDILVEYSKTPGLFDFIRTENFLSKALGSRVDLVIKGSLKPVIGRNVMREVVFI